MCTMTEYTLASVCGSTGCMLKESRNHTCVYKSHTEASVYSAMVNTHSADGTYVPWLSQPNSVCTYMHMYLIISTFIDWPTHAGASVKQL